MLREQPTTDHDGTAAAAPSDLAEAAEALAPACTQGEAARAMEREQPTADHDLAEVAETPASACAQDNKSDGEQPRSPRRPRARLPSRLLGGNDATRRDTAKGGKKAAKNSPHAASPTRLAGFSTLRRLRAARPATPNAPKTSTVNCWAAARVGHSQWEYASTDLRTYACGPRRATNTAGLPADAR